MVQPRASQCPQGDPLGPFLDSLTFSSSSASWPINRWTLAVSSRGGISCAMAVWCGNFLAMLGVGISHLSWGMISYSVRVGKTNSALLIDRAVMPATLWPYFSSLSLYCMWTGSIYLGTHQLQDRQPIHWWWGSCCSACRWWRRHAWWGVGYTCYRRPLAGFCYRTRLL